MAIPWGAIGAGAVEGGEEGAVLGPWGALAGVGVGIGAAILYDHFKDSAANPDASIPDTAQPDSNGRKGNPGEKDPCKGLDPAESWGRPNTLADHFARHGADFGAKTAEEYAEMASKFLQEALANGYPTKIGPGGTIRVYDPSTNTFGSYNSDGTTKTFYKPDPSEHHFPTNQDYWDHQPGCEP